MLLSLAPATAEAGEGPFLHQQMLRAHAGEEPVLGQDLLFPSAAQLEGRGRDEHAIVMGYLPYWVSADNLPWEHLDVIAWFSAEMNTDGSLGNSHGWGGAGSDALIDAAHAVGARVVLSTTLFGGGALGELLGSVVARNNAINSLVSAMIDGGGDGIDVDFEGLDLANREDLSAFIIALRAAMDIASPGSHLSLATPAVDWDGSYDYDVLASNSDLLFIMGYAFAGSWSGPKPNAPLASSSQWGSRSLQWSAQDYIEWGGVDNAPGIVMGLPLYGNQWTTSSGDVGADAIAHVGSTFYATCAERFDEHGRNWDSDSSTPWAAWQEGSQWRQMWCEDDISIGMKAQMALDEGLGGFGFWALDYDEGDALLWETVGAVLDGSYGGDDDDSAGDDDDDSAQGDDDDSAGDDDDSAGGDDDDDTGGGGRGQRSGCGSGGCHAASALGAVTAAPSSALAAGLILAALVGRRRRLRRSR